MNATDIYHTAKQHIKLIQVTDCHLLADPSQQYKYIAPRDSLDNVCHSIAKKHADAQILLLTGDLSQDESLESYIQLKEALSSLNLDIYALPGNHDNFGRLGNICGDLISLNKSISCGTWHLILLHSQLAGSVEGYLSTNELDWLDHGLRCVEDKHILLALHHQPFPTGSAWMDRIGLTNTQEFLSIIRKHPGVRVLIHGHTHQVGFKQWRQLSCYGTPSSWRQFAPYSRECRMDHLPPAYRVIELYRNGEHRSWIEFV